MTEFTCGVDTTGWTNEEKSALIAAADIEKEAQAIEANVSNVRSSPSAIIAERKRIAEIAKRDALDNKAILDAETKHGKDNVMFVRTKCGAIIMVCPTKTQDAAVIAANEKARAELKDQDAVTFSYIRSLLDFCVHPMPARIEEMRNEIPRFDDIIATMYANMVNGLSERMLGK